MALDPVSSVSDALTAALGMGTKLVEHFFPDPVACAAAKLKLLELAQNGQLQAMAGQLAVDNTEAASSDRLQHWRGALGWVCTTAFAYHYVIFPLAAHYTSIQDIDTSTMYPLLMGMLGLGAMHVTERIQGA